MSKSSSPPALSLASSSSALSHQRPKRLGLHESRIADAPNRNRARMPETEIFDSAHFEAARRLRVCREETGLTQEELAVLSDEDPKTVGLRERGQVSLGPLRMLVVLERAAGAKAKK
jgi:DNA-binding XRE family transcriptional regulator